MTTAGRAVHPDPRRSADRQAPQGARRHQALHAVRRAPVLRLRRLPRGGHRHRGRAPRAGRDVRRRGLGEGHPRTRCRCADRRARRHQRHERDGRRDAEPLAAAGARRARAADALGAGLAAGDRPRAVRAAGDEVRARRPTRPPRSRASSTRRWRPRCARTRARRSWTCRWTSCSWRRRRTGDGPALPDPLDEPVAEGVERALALLDDAERPVIMAGTDMYWGKGERALLELAERRGIPVFLNGLARGCVPADHELFFSRARSEGLKGADVALVVGVPMDFRLGFGGSFGEETQIVVLGRTEPERDHPRAPAVELYGGMDATLRALIGDGRDTAVVGLAPARGRDGEARGGGSRARRRPRAAAPDAALQGARRGARSRRGRDRRRRRLRLLRRPRHQHLRAGLLAGSGPVRLPGQRAGLRAGGEARAPRQAGGAAGRRRRVRLQRAWSSTRSRATASTSSA